MIYDVRIGASHEVMQIVFADTEDDFGAPQACQLEPETGTVGKFITIMDGQSERVFINSIDHAKNLIKALEKAIALGWLE